MSSDRSHAVCWFVPWFGILYRCSCGHFEKRPYGWGWTGDTPDSTTS